VTQSFRLPRGGVVDRSRPLGLQIDGRRQEGNAGDTRAAALLLADDVLIYESGEVERSKVEYASHHLGADAEFAAAVKSSVTRRAGRAIGEIAWIASEGRTTGNFNGRPIDQMTAETMVLQRTGKAWKIVQIHWSSAKAR
jgi:hypothetical protein